MYFHLCPIFITKRTQALVFRLIACQFHQNKYLLQIQILPTMIYSYLMIDLPLLAMSKIISTSCNFTQKKKKTPSQQTSKTNQTVTQDKLCILCMDLWKSSSTPPRWIDWEAKLAQFQSIIYPAKREEKKTFLEQAAFWHEVKVV